MSWLFTLLTHVYLISTKFTVNFTLLGQSLRSFETKLFPLMLGVFLAHLNDQSRVEVLLV